jgi:hypothetical protein
MVQKSHLTAKNMILIMLGGVLLKIALTTSHEMADDVGVTSIHSLLERKLPEHTIV